MTENYETSLPETFDPATQEGTAFDLIPVGVYVAQVIEACVAQPQTGNGHYIALTWQITEGKHEGRFVWQRITFLHSSAQAVTIGRQQFKDLCVATGISAEVTDVEVFKFISCDIKVGIEQDKKGVYPDKNRVSRIWSLGQAPKPKTAAGEPKKPAPATTATTTVRTTTTAPPAAAKPAAASANGPTPPWRKPKPTLAEETGDEIPH